ncbi:hypothetical protein J6590_076504 [Homalodisca vitripennis]|nr:hypothetical protein J6590_076504 [Homalodisca vitripennis]
MVKARPRIKGSRYYQLDVTTEPAAGATSRRVFVSGWRSWTCSTFGRSSRQLTAQSDHPSSVSAASKLHVVLCLHPLFCSLGLATYCCFVIEFLNLFQNYPCLWDVSSQDYINRNVKETAYNKLLENVMNTGMPATVELLKKKIKSLRDTYRKELSKIKKSIKSGAGANEVYKPKLVWYSNSAVRVVCSLLGVCECE